MNFIASFYYNSLCGVATFLIFDIVNIRQYDKIVPHFFYFSEISGSIGQKYTLIFSFKIPPIDIIITATLH